MFRNVLLSKIKGAKLAVLMAAVVLVSFVGMKPIHASAASQMEVNPLPIHTAISRPENWTSRYSSVDYPTGSLGSAFSVSAGANRLLVVAIASTRTTAGTQTVSVSYGGMPLTLAAGDANASAYNHTYLYYLKEPDIPAGSNSLSVSISGGISFYTWVYSAVYAGVDQTTPVSGSGAANYNSGNTNNEIVGPFSPTLTIGANEQAIEVVNLARSNSGGGARTILTWAAGWITAGVEPPSITSGNPTATMYIRDRNLLTAANDPSQHTASTNQTLDSMSAMSIRPVPDYVLSVVKIGSGTGTVTSNPGTITCGATCSAPFAPGASVVLTASADAGSTVTSWNPSRCNGSTTCTVSMVATRTVTVTFSRPLTPVAPANGSSMPNFNNTFSWTGVNPAATHYVLELTTNAGAAVIAPAWLTPAQTNCTGADLDCTVTLNLGTLAFGDYRWRVVDYNANYSSYGLWTGYQSFSLVAPVLNSVTALAPANGSSMPSFNNTFAWTGVSGANYYILELRKADDTLVIAPAWLTTTQTACIPNDLDCTVTLNLGTLGSGDYKWRVRAYSSVSYQYGAWTEYQAFTISAPPAIVLSPVTALTPADGASMPSFNNTFAWTGVSGADNYILDLRKADDTLVIAPAWLTTTQTACIPPGDVDCTVTLNLGSLAFGNYKWRVRAYSTVNHQYGEWTNYQNFSIVAPVLNPVTPLMPTGPMTTFDNTFTWTGVGGADNYILELRTESDALVIAPAWLTAAQTNCVPNDLDCTVTLNLGSLASGGYKWRVRAYSTVSYQYGDWTEYQSFTISP